MGNKRKIKLCLCGREAKAGHHKCPACYRKQIKELRKTLSDKHIMLMAEREKDEQYA